MATKTYKPTTASMRHTQLEDRSSLTSKSPEKRLVTGKRPKAGRNASGRVTVRHRSGGVKRKLRMIDHKKDKFDVPGIVDSLEYDPNLSAHIALIKYADGDKRYVIAEKSWSVGQEVISGEEVQPKPGNTLRLKNIPSGTPVFDVELTPGKGGQLGRSAGVSISVQGLDPSGKYTQLKMPSGEIRLVNAECLATVGTVSNIEHMNVKLGKAGRKRHLGWRPAVRGMAMHAKQHPHGGGEGKGVIGGGHTGAKDLWGTRIGTKTRRNKRTSKFIIKRRTTKRRPNKTV